MASYHQPVLQDVLHDKMDQLIKQEMQCFHKEGVALRSLLLSAALPEPESSLGMKHSFCEFNPVLNALHSSLATALDAFTKQNLYLMEEEKWSGELSLDLNAKFPEPGAKEKITSFFNSVSTLHLS